MSLERCNDCGQYNFNPPCACEAYEVAHDYGEPDTIRATSMRAAVEEWAEQHDARGDHTIIRGNPETVTVRRGDDEKVFSVRGEMMPQYDATEVDQ